VSINTVTTSSAEPQYLIQQCGTVCDMNTELVEPDSRFYTWIQQNSKTTALIISQYTVPVMKIGCSNV